MVTILYLGGPLKVLLPRFAFSDCGMPVTCIAYKPRCNYVSNNKNSNNNYDYYNVLTCYDLFKLVTITKNNSYSY